MNLASKQFNKNILNTIHRHNRVQKCSLWNIMITSRPRSIMAIHRRILRPIVYYVGQNEKMYFYLFLMVSGISLRDQYMRGDSQILEMRNGEPSIPQQQDIEYNQINSYFLQESLVVLFILFYTISCSYFRDFKPYEIVVARASIEIKLELFDPAFQSSSTVSGYIVPVELLVVAMLFINEKVCARLSTETGQQPNSPNTVIICIFIVLPSINSYNLLYIISNIITNSQLIQKIYKPHTTHKKNQKQFNISLHRNFLQQKITKITKITKISPQIPTKIKYPPYTASFIFKIIYEYKRQQNQEYYFQLKQINMTWIQSFFAFFNGMVAGWSQVFVMQPFQIIKVRLQTQPSNAKVYDGILDCLVKIVKNQGPLALYKGTVTPLIGVGMLGSVRFGSYEFFKKKMGQAEGKSPADLKRIQKSICAFFAGAVNSILLSPIQHTRIRVQIQRTATEKIYTGSVDALVKVTKNHGLKGLYRGFTPSFIRQSTGLAFYFTTIQYLTDYFTPPGITSKKDLPVWVPFIAGGIGGTTYWMFNYPIDYVKTLMQTDKFGEFKFKSTLDCFRKQLQEGGIKTFYKGYLICMMRSFPVNAAAMVTYRIMQRISNVTSH